MTPRVATVILILLVLLVASVVSSGRIPHPLGRGPRAAEGGHAGAEELRRLVLSRAQRLHAAGETSRAWTAWREAFATARARRDWRGLIEVGDVAMAMKSGGRARQSYAAALTVAREEPSVEGVLRSGEAFAGLGDRRAMRHAIRIAERLAGDEPAARARIRDFETVFASAPASRPPASAP